MLQQPSEGGHQGWQQYKAQQHGFQGIHEEQGFGLLVEAMALFNDNCSSSTGVG
jgi:hypothetical protein